MFEQFGTDYSKDSLNLQGLLPSVNQSEATNSILSTLFQRWVTKPTLQNVAGSIGFSKNVFAAAIEETSAYRQAYQLSPIFTTNTGETSNLYDWNDILRKAKSTGVDPARYHEWGATTSLEYRPPINFDKFVNYQNYFWVNQQDTTEAPDYVTITTAGNSDWSKSNKWVTINDVGANIAFAKRAQVPIIEFDDIELSMWAKVVRTWNTRKYSSAEFVPTSLQPTIADIQSASFTTLWELASESLVPTISEISPTVAKYLVNVVNHIAILPVPALRNQGAVVVFGELSDAPGTYGIANQQTDVIELEGAGQYCNSIQLPSIASGTVQVVIGTISALDNSELEFVSTRVAASVSVYTPNTGTPLGNVQLRNLTSYRLVGQRRTQKFQLPAFNLYLPVSSTEFEIHSSSTVFQYERDVSQVINALTGQRIAITNSSEDFAFYVPLVDSSDKLLAFKRNGPIPQYSTVWSNRTTQTPSYVGADRLPRVDSHGNPDFTQPGGWEPSPLLTNNPLRETRTNFRLSEVFPHFTAIAAGMVGTIRIIDDGGSNFVSSLIATDLSVPNLINFVAGELVTFRQQQETRIVSSILHDETIKSLAPTDMVQYIVNTLIQSAVVGQDSIYVDTPMYDSVSGRGFPSYPLSLAMARVVAVTTPIVVLGNGEKHLLAHDGSTISISPTVRAAFSQMEDSLGTVFLTGVDILPQPSNGGKNMAVWRKNPAEVYKFIVDYYTDSEPSSPRDQATWYNPNTQVAKQWTGNAWVGIDARQLWNLFTVEDIIINAIKRMEDQVAAYINYLNFPVITGWDVSGTPSQPVALRLITSYQLQPIHTINKLVGWNGFTVNGLHIVKASGNVLKQSTPLHGENLYRDFTFLNSLVYYTRRNNLLRGLVSPLVTWRTWTTALAYQTNSLIVPQTTKLYQGCDELTDYSVMLKKSENMREIPFSNIIITLEQAGSNVSLQNEFGYDWIYRLTCSEPTKTTRYRYSAVDQDLVWRADTNTFVSVLGDPIQLTTGDEFHFVNPPTGISTGLFYARVVANKLSVYQTETAARLGLVYDPQVTLLPGMSQAIKFADSTGQVRVRKIQTVFTAAEKNWQTVSIDRTNIVAFTFPVVITGIQNMIDWINTYTAYMIDDGVIPNSGEDAQVDPDTGTIINWQQQIVKAIEKIYGANGLSNRSYLPTGEDSNRISVTNAFAELNPFRDLVFVGTQFGVVCDIDNVPYVNEHTSTPAVYDDKGEYILSNELIPLRTDRVTTLRFTDSQPPRAGVPQTIDNVRHIGGGSISLDYYEHVIVFDAQTANGLVIYDRFFNLQKRSLTLETQKSVDFFYRPVMGGFSVTASGTIPNFETVAEYQRNDYDVFESNELIPSTLGVRAMLGKDPLPYFQTVPVSSKTEFQFWQQMIREKGAKDAVSIFSRHDLYDNIIVPDEYWAWKLGTFGSIHTRSQVQLQLTLDDVLHNAVTMHFADSAPSEVSEFPISQIAPYDQSRWLNFPDYVNVVNTNNISITEYAKSSPLRIVDTGTNSVIRTLPVWNPIRNYHTSDIGTFDIIKFTDPAEYNKTRLPITDVAWSSRQLGIYWLDSSSMRYKPYNTNAFSFDDQTRKWGQLEDGVSLQGYQWVTSNTAPTATSVDIPLSRVVSLTRRQLLNVAWTSNSSAHTTVFYSAQPIEFVTGDAVCIYNNQPAIAEVTALLGVVCLVTVLSTNTFELRTTTNSLDAGDLVYLSPSSATITVMDGNWDAVPAVEKGEVIVEFPITTASQSSFTVIHPDIVNKDDLITDSTLLVNGMKVGSRIVKAGTGVVTATVVDNQGNPINLPINSRVVLKYTKPSANPLGEYPPLTSDQQSFVFTEYPHVEIVSSASSTYYYWAAAPTTPSKSVSIPELLQGIIYPSSGCFFASREIVGDSTEYVTLWGLKDLHNVSTKIVAIDTDASMRDKYTSLSESKPINEQWTLFREQQEYDIHDDVWNYVVTTIVGTRGGVIVPSTARVSYDYTYGTNTSYGTGNEQTLIPVARARALFWVYFSPANSDIDVTLQPIFQTAAWLQAMEVNNYTDATTIVKTMFPATTITAFVLTLIREGLYLGYHYEGIFKTSLVALHTSRKVVGV